MIWIKGIVSLSSPAFKGHWCWTSVALDYHHLVKREYTYRVVFFNWASPEFAKCWPVSNWFQKNIRVPDWPPIGIENVKVFGISPFSAAILRTFPKQGGPVEAILGGASLKTFSGEAQLKKPPCIFNTDLTTLAVTLPGWRWTYPSTAVLNFKSSGFGGFAIAPVAVCMYFCSGVKTFGRTV